MGFRNVGIVMVKQCRTCHYGRGRSGHGVAPDGMRCFLNPPIRVQLSIMIKNPDDKWERPQVEEADMCSHWSESLE